ncbi:MAG: crossover junction endodeoxyribonuclease RuvC [Planctomycetes bacterium]|nr:crossover junction endodeoxyribonuclease RuvC [Planctomycetota bacterium]
MARSSNNQFGRISPGYRILGIDPGTRSVGYAVLELDRSLKPVVLAHGAAAARAALPISDRLKKIYLSLAGLLEKSRPDVVVVEEVFYGKNFQSALKIGEGRGVVLLAAALAGRAVVEYPPATVKQAVTGNGRATKDQVERVIARLLKLEKPIASPDAADALAIAFCHAQRVRGRLRALGGPAGWLKKKRRRQGSSLQKLLDRLKISR